jgi:hypothetical protein
VLDSPVYYDQKSGFQDGEIQLKAARELLAWMNAVSITTIIIADAGPLCVQCPPDHVIFHSYNDIICDEHVPPSSPVYLAHC